MARAIDKRIMLDLIIEAKKTDPETGPFSEWMAEYLVDHLPTLTPPNEPLTQADLDSMDYDKVWLDYGGDGEWALVVSGRIYAMAVLEGAGFEDILRDEVGGETMDRPSGNYTVYRRPPNEPLTLEQIKSLYDSPAWYQDLYRKMGYWIIVGAIGEIGVHLTDLDNANEFYSTIDYGARWALFRRPPEGDADA